MVLHPLADIPNAVDMNVLDVQDLTRHRLPLNALTGLRFFAASYVVIFHTRLSTALDGHGFHRAGSFVGNGYMAVSLFFLLSGYILAYNYRGQIETRNHAFRFWEARFARIWPAYVFSLLCSSFPVSNLPPWPLALTTLGMLQSWNPFHPEYAKAWNFVCWTLSVEAFFYLVFPLLQILLEKLRPLRLIFVGSCVALVGVLCNTPYHSFTTRYPGPWFYIPAPVIHLPEFLAGVILGNLFLDLATLSTGFKATEGRSAVGPEADGANRAGSGARFPLLTTAGFICSMVVLSTPHGRLEGLIIPAFGLLLYGLASERTLLSRFLSTRVLILGGEISYAMYLLRFPLQQWMIAIPALRASRLVEFLYLPFGLIPFSILSFYFIEGPSRRALRRLFAVLQSRQA